MEDDFQTKGLYIALVHYPVYDKGGNIVAAAITSLDIHDIARLARTYGAEGFYLVTPLASQVVLVRKILDHWLHGYGARYNPNRREALGCVRTAGTIEEVVDEVREKRGGTPLLIATGAKRRQGTTGYTEMREVIRNETRPLVLLLGTGWGLAEEVIETTDFQLAPIDGADDYNHLSVRCAAAIILDRLLARV